MADQPETVTFTIEGPDGTTDDVQLPAGLADLLGEPGDTEASVVGDMALLSLVQQIHAAVHHGEDDVDEDVRAMEERASDLFEERFGISFAEATGHSH